MKMNPKTPRAILTDGTGSCMKTNKTHNNDKIKLLNSEIPVYNHEYG